MARAYTGTVMLEGTTLSEGRGTKGRSNYWRPRYRRPARHERDANIAPQWLHDCRLRDCWFEPTFDKHVGKLCNGVQIHAEDSCYQHQASSHGVCRPRLQGDPPFVPGLSAMARLPYEYEHGKLAIDVINGGPLLREWVDDAMATAAGLGRSHHAG